MQLKKITNHIPNTLTSLNLLGGCLSIVVAFSGELRLSAIILLVAFHADVFDGLTARLLKSHSSIGKELDSLADLISFGLAPAVILHVILKQQFEVEHFSFQLPTSTWISLLIPLLLPVFAGLRLAKFNVDDRQTDGFLGLPTPANALMVLSLPLIAFKQPYSFLLDLLWTIPGVLVYSVLVSFLMVAPIRLYGLKLKGFSWKANKFTYIFLGFGLIVILTFYHTGLFLVIVLYILYGIFLSQLQKRKIIP